MKILEKMGVFALFLCLFLVSCKQDPLIIENPNDTPAYEVPVKEVIASLAGVVVNEAGIAMEEATVQVGNVTVLTDENGVFRISGLKMNAYGTLVKVGKSGYFLGAQMVNATAGERSDTRFVLMAKEVVGTVAAATGGTVTANADSKITLPANGIATASGDIYNGEVSVAARWIDPTSNNLGLIMPGDLRAIDATQEAVQLATYGMLAVELEGAAGEALNIAEGSTASLEFPVPVELQAAAPATIPLWHFDEATGFWVEEGEATFDGEKYVGSVSHFSFWNCDAPFPLVEMEGSVVDQDGNPLADVYVTLQMSSSAYARGGLTDAHGIFGGKIPKDVVLTLKVRLAGVCSDVLYTGTIGPFSDDVTLPQIVIDISNTPTVSSFNVMGQMENCAGDVITDGYLKLIFNGEVHVVWPDDNGQLERGVVHCSTTNTLDVVGYDNDAEKKSNLTTYTIPTNGEVDLGSISVCEDIVERIDYTIDGDAFVVFDPAATLDVDVLSISGFGPDSTSVEIQVTATAPGTYQPNFAQFSGLVNNTFPYAYCQGATAGCVDFDVTITALGAVGELIEGTFDGTMQGSNTGGTSTVSGAFKAIRQ